MLHNTLPQIAFYFDLLFALAVAFIPVQFGLYDCAVSKPYFANSLAFTPSGFPICPVEPAQLSYAPAGSYYCYAMYVANDFQVHLLCGNKSKKLACIKKV